MGDGFAEGLAVGQNMATTLMLGEENGFGSLSFLLYLDGAETAMVTKVEAK